MYPQMHLCWIIDVVVSVIFKIWFIRILDKTDWSWNSKAREIDKNVKRLFYILFWKWDQDMLNITNRIRLNISIYMEQTQLLCIYKKIGPFHKSHLCIKCYALSETYLALICGSIKLSITSVPSVPSNSSWAKTCIKHFDLK